MSRVFERRSTLGAPLNASAKAVATWAKNLLKNSAPTPPKKKKSKRRQLYDLHTWVGFHLAVIMVLVLATGTFATVSNELDWLIRDEMRVTPVGEEVSWQEMIDAVEAYDPSVTVASLSKMQGDHFAYRAQVVDGDGILKFIHVNQWTGEVTGETGWFTVQRLFRDLHRYLFLPKLFGLTIVCSMAIILGISLYTGLKTSRNWRTLMTRVRFSKGARTAIGDAHKAAGLWSIWFFVVIIATGVWYYAEFLGKNFEPKASPELREMTVVDEDVVVYPSLDEIYAVAQAAYPELNIASIRYGNTASSAITVVGKAGNPIVRKRANAVYLHPQTLDVIEVRKSKNFGPVVWLNQIADPLHFGSFGGLPVKLIWFTFGLFMTGLSVSGVWLTWRRLKSRGASKVQLAVLPILVVTSLFGSFQYTATSLPILAGIDPGPYVLFVTGLFCAGGALALGVWLIQRCRKGPPLTIGNAGLATATIVLAAGGIYGSALQNPFAKGEELILQSAQSGPVAAEAHLVLSEDGQPTGDARFLISGTDGRLNVSTMAVSLERHGAPLKPEAEPIERRFRFLAHSQPAYISLPTDQLNEATDLVATFEMKTGNTFSIAWPLPADNERLTQASTDQ